MNRMRSIRSYLPPIIFASMLAGCISRSLLPDKVSNLLDDKTTTARVEAALKSNGGNELSGVVATTTNSVVTLRGSVPSPEARSRAAAITRGVDHVKEVHDEIQVRSAGPNR
jgi:osmotically-inducible protein OsmY